MSGRLYIKLEVHVVWKAWYWGTWLGTRKMQVVCVKVVTSSSVANPKFLGTPNTLNLSEKQYFLPDIACQSKKWQDMLAVWGYMAPLTPMSTPVVARKKKEQYLLDVKSSTDKKLARPLDTAEWKAPLSISDATFGCYQLDCLQTEIICWSSITVVLNLSSIDS